MLSIFFPRQVETQIWTGDRVPSETPVTLPGTNPVLDAIDGQRSSEVGRPRGFLGRLVQHAIARAQLPIDAIGDVFHLAHFVKKYHSYRQVIGVVSADFPLIAPKALNQ